MSQDYRCTNCGQAFDQDEMDMINVVNKYANVLCTNCHNAQAIIIKEWMEAQTIWVRQIRELQETKGELVAALGALAATARTFRNVPAQDQQWTSIDDQALENAFAILAKMKP